MQISLQLHAASCMHAPFSFQVVLAIAKSSFCWACACKTRIGCRNVGHRLGMWVTGYELSTRDDDPTSTLTSLNTAFNEFRLELQGEMKLVRDEMVEQKNP